MIKTMKVVKERDGFEVGKVIRVMTVPSCENVTSEYKQYSGMYVCGDDNFNEVFFSKDELEEYHLSFEEIMKNEIVHTCKGVQKMEDMFSSLEEDDYNLEWDRYDEFRNRFTSEYFDHWLCTDTWVGIGVLSVDGERVALFSQTARKNNCHFKWLSKESKIKVRMLVQEYMKSDDHYFQDVLEDGENLINFIYG